MKEKNSSDMDWICICDFDRDRQGRPLLRLLCDGLPQVLCILPWFESESLLQGLVVDVHVRGVFGIVE